MHQPFSVAVSSHGLKPSLILHVEAVSLFLECPFSPTIETLLLGHLTEFLWVLKTQFLNFGGQVRAFPKGDRSPDPLSGKWVHTFSISQIAQRSWALEPDAWASE